MSDTDTRSTPEAGPIILFDGVCNLCNGFVQFVIRRDPEGKFRFAPLQSDVGDRLLERCGLETDQMDTLVLVDEGGCFTKSAAALRIAGDLGGAYRVLSLARFLPRPLRDAAYDFVSENRYQWFGRVDQCLVPDSDLESRFLATDAVARRSESDD